MIVALVIRTLVYSSSSVGVSRHGWCCSAAKQTALQLVLVSEAVIQQWPIVGMVSSGMRAQLQLIAQFTARWYNMCVGSHYLSTTSLEMVRIGWTCIPNCNHLNTTSYLPTEQCALALHRDYFYCLRRTLQLPRVLFSGVVHPS